mgnify:CR=1 FL=1
MKLERVSEHIWSLKTWIIVPVRVWLVADQTGITLVDAGLSYMARPILQYIERLQAGPLKRILLTHGHSDHIGALKEIVKIRPVPVFAHRTEIPYMEGRLAYPRRKKPVQNVPCGLVQPLEEVGDGNLAEISGLKPYWTPGHSPGHAVYYHEQDRVLLAGDLFTSKRGKLHRPMPWFTADMAEAVKSGAIVKKLNPLRLEICHGGPVMNPAGQWEQYNKRMEALYSVS